MDSKIAASIISSGVVLLGLFYNMYKNKKQFDRTQNNLRFNLDYERVKERRDIEQSKLDEFYLPLKNYLQRSKHAYQTLTQNKPKDFRTLDFLLNREILFDGNKIDWNENDDVILKRIFSIGIEIENLIINQGSSIQDVEFREVYVPSPGFEDKEYPEGISLFEFALEHFSYIRDVYYGNIENDARFNKFKYPRELNTRVLAKIEETKEKIRIEENSMNSFRAKII